MTTRKRTLVTAQLLALGFHVGPRTIYRWRMQRGLPTVMVGPKVRFDLAEVERWAEREGLRFELPDLIIDFAAIS
jgi:excisionase family DNA binding protein